ncbi:hypothetical protein [Kitasatospora sp. NBC_00315]|uniref:hypothetical protein n=1 Tax=Kitasatospora sp. NBC_00315 TaxID=2975963 RepID=UPI00324A111B
MADGSDPKGPAAGGVREGSGEAGFRVRPGELEGAAESARRTAELVPGGVGGLLAASDRAERALSGWAAGRELAACTDAWRARLDALAAELDRQGGNLCASAGNYRACEESAARGPSRVLAHH